MNDCCKSLLQVLEGVEYFYKKAVGKASASRSKEQNIYTADYGPVVEASPMWRDVKQKMVDVWGIVPEMHRNAWRGKAVQLLPHTFRDVKLNSETILDRLFSKCSSEKIHVPKTVSQVFRRYREIVPPPEAVCRESLCKVYPRGGYLRFVGTK